MENKNKIIIQSVLALVLILLIVVIFVVDLNLGLFKVVSFKSLQNAKSELNTSEESLKKVKAEYNNLENSVINNKDEFKKQKDKYDAISDNTVNIIKEATTEEKYSAEYIWIKLGNYAKTNNLTLSLIEPGGTNNTDSTTTQTDTTSKTNTTNQGTTNQGTDNTKKESSSTNDTTLQTNNKTETGSKNVYNAEPETPSNTTTTSVNAPANTATSNNELTIKVKGNYIDVSDFIFELENDKELRFKLDKIKMEYAGNNQITASFIVKNMVFLK